METAFAEIKPETTHITSVCSAGAEAACSGVSFAPWACFQRREAASWGVSFFAEINSSISFVQHLAHVSANLNFDFH
jgi:hypothetical protein